MRVESRPTVSAGGDAEVPHFGFETFTSIRTLAARLTTKLNVQSETKASTRKPRIDDEAYNPDYSLSEVEQLALCALQDDEFVRRNHEKLIRNKQYQMLLSARKDGLVSGVIVTHALYNEVLFQAAIRLLNEENDSQRSPNRTWNHAQVMEQYDRFGKIVADELDNYLVQRPLSSPKLTGSPDGAHGLNLPSIFLEAYKRGVIGPSRLADALGPSAGTLETYWYLQRIGEVTVE